jgi:hypothetical protein
MTSEVNSARKARYVGPCCQTNAETGSGTTRFVAARREHVLEGPQVEAGTAEELFG